MENTFSLRQDLYLLNHPFYQAWMQGTLSKQSLQDYVRQYYHHVEAFPGYLKKSLELSQDQEVNQALAENLAEEDGATYGVSHPELWLNFAKGLEVSVEEVKSVELRAGIKNVVNTFNSFSSKNLPAALGALYAYESQVPEIAGSKIEGLKKHFNITDQQSLEFFEVHKTADVEHRNVIYKLIERLSPQERQQAKVAADVASQALWDFLSDVYQANGYDCAG